MAHRINRRRQRWTEQREKGSIVIDVAVLAPVILLAIIFVAWAGAQTSADAAAMSSARAAARAAAIEINPANATSAGESAGTSATERSSCSDIRVIVDTSEWDQGWVSAEAVCTLADVGASFGSNTITRTWTEPVGLRGRSGR